MDVEENLKIDTIPKNNMVSVMSYNILMNKWCKDSPFQDSRGKRISDAIITDKPDFVMMQEVDDIKNSMENVRLEEMYNYLQVDKRVKTHGLLTLYNKNRFILIQDKLIYLDEEAQDNVQSFNEETMERCKKPYILHLMIFEDILNDMKPICVTNAHFEYSPVFDDIKYLQMVMTLNIATQYVNNFDEVRQSVKMTPMVLIGDYNSRPGSNAANVIYNREPIESRIELAFYEDHVDKFMKHMKIAYKLLDTESVEKFGLKNAYSFYQKAVKNEMSKKDKSKELDLLHSDDILIPKEEKGQNSEAKGFPEFTNFTKDFKDTIDHIFYSSNLQLLKLRKLPNFAEMKRENIMECPNAVWPSDHMPIGAVFVYDSYEAPQFII